MLIFVQLRGSDTLITKISLFELSQSDLAFMQEGQFKRAFCFMKVINFYPFQKFLIACDGNIKDALFIVYIVEQFETVKTHSVDFLVFISDEEISEHTGLTIKEIKSCFARVSSKFPIAKKAYKSLNGNVENVYELNLSKVYSIIQYPF